MFRISIYLFFISFTIVSSIQSIIVDVFVETG